MNNVPSELLSVEVEYKDDFLPDESPHSYEEISKPSVVSSSLQPKPPLLEKKGGGGGRRQPRSVGVFAPIAPAPKNRRGRPHASVAKSGAASGNTDKKEKNLTHVKKSSVGTSVAAVAPANKGKVMMMSPEEKIKSLLARVNDKYANKSSSSSSSEKGKGQGQGVGEGAENDNQYELDSAFEDDTEMSPLKVVNLKVTANNSSKLQQQNIETDEYDDYEDDT